MGNGKKEKYLKARAREEGLSASAVKKANGLNCNEEKNVFSTIFLKLPEPTSVIDYFPSFLSSGSCTVAWSLVVAWWTC